MEKIDDSYLMPFGIYKRIPLGKVPSHYLIYIYENGKSGRLTDYIENKIEALRKDENEKLGNS